VTPRFRTSWVVLGIACVLLVAAIIVRFNLNTTQSAEGWLERGREALDRQDLAAAQAILERLESMPQVDPNDLGLFRAQCLIAQNRIAEAIEALAAIPDEFPLSAQVRLKQGQLELRRHRLASAERALTRATQLDPNLVQAHRELIYILGYQVRRAELRARYQALAQTGTLTPYDVYLWCLTRYNTWDAAEHFDDLQRFVRAEPTDEWSRLALARAAIALNRIDEGLAILQPLDPEHPEVRLVRAQAELARGDLNQADALLAANPPDHVESLRLRGKLALYRNHPNDAAAFYRRAVELAPEDREGVIGLAQSLKAAHDPEADRWLNAARDHERYAHQLHQLRLPENQNNPESWRIMADLCERIGCHAEAAAWYQLLIARNPLDSEAQAALARLKARQESGTAGIGP